MLLRALFLAALTCVIASSIDGNRYHLQNVGLVKVSASDKQYIYVGSSLGVVAALNASNGDLVWRRVFSSAVDALQLTNDVVVISVAGCSRMAALSAANGSIVWKHRLSFGASDSCQLTTQMLDNVPHVLLHQSSGLSFLNAVNGNIRWTFECSEECQWLLTVEHNEHGVHIVSLLAGGAVQSKMLTMDGTAVPQSITLPALPFGDLKDGVCVTLLNVWYVCKSAHSSAVWCVNIRTGGVRHDVTVGAWNAQDDHVSFSAARDDVLVATVNHRLQVVAKFHPPQTNDETNSARLELLYEARTSPTAMDILADRHGGMYIMTFAIQQNHTNLAIIQSTNGAVRHVQQLSLTLSQYGHAQTVFAYDGSVRNFRTLLVTQSGDMSLISSNGIEWTRHEGLAHITKALVAALPHLGTDAIEVNERDLSWDAVVTRLQTVSASIVSSASLLFQRDVSAQRHYSDIYGFRKVVVLASSTGKVFGLDNESGRVLWSRMYIGEAGQAAVFQQVLLTRPATHNEPECLIVGYYPMRLSSAHRSFLSVVNPVTGLELHRTIVPFVIESVYQLRCLLPQGSALVVLLDDRQMIQLFPNSDASAALFGVCIHNVTLLHIAQDMTMIRGLSVAPQPTAGGIFTTKLQWQRQEVDQVLAIATRRSDDAIFRTAHVLGDKTLLYKYLSDNLLIIATAGQDVMDDTDRVLRFIDVKLIESNDGKAVFSTQHMHCSGPVHALLVENRLVYHYWNELKRAHELSVMDIVKDVADNWQTFGQYYAGAEPVDHKKLRFLRQTFGLPGSVKAIAHTVSDSGINLKYLLFAVNHSVVALTPQDVDPRRPLVSNSWEEQQEGLARYEYQLPMANIGAVITGDIHMEQMRGIVTASTRLESSTVVVVYGLDLFFARVALGGTYDMLGPEFKKSHIVAWLIVLTSATIWAYRWSKRRALARAWA